MAHEVFTRPFPSPRLTTYGTDASQPLMKGRLLSRREAAELLNVSPKTVWRLTRSGELRTHRVGHQLRLAEVDVEAYLNRE
jgi:excisionase family DNA binding protein